MKIKKEEYYGLDHKKVYKNLEGDLEFIGEFTVIDNYRPSAVYKNHKPNRSKGHKDYVMLTEVIDDPISLQAKWYISGLDKKEMEKYRYQHAIHCLSCDTVLYSINRHHFHKCDCSNETSVDGGRDYLKYGGKDLDKIEVVKLDLITKEIKKSPQK